MSILTDKQLSDMEQWAHFDLGAGKSQLVDAGGDDVVALINEVRELRKLRAAIETALATARGAAQ